MEKNIKLSKSTQWLAKVWPVEDLYENVSESLHSRVEVLWAPLMTVPAARDSCILQSEVQAIFL